MIIKKGTHAPLRLPKLLVGHSMVGYRVKFTDSCAYDIGPDQADINKLFGIGYFPHHHKNSVRFGWRYSNGEIEILSYWYLNGERNSDLICSVPLNKPMVYKIHILRDWHTLTVSEGLSDFHSHSFNVPVPGKNFGYLLSTYFGGNLTAPHNIEINLERL
jgi:hypothetical protein